jgi:cyclohexadienyl dehydratase
MKKTIIRIISFLGIGFGCLALLVIARNKSDTLLADIRSRGVLRVGTTGDYAPFSFRDSNSGQLKGFDIDQANSLAKALGVHTQFVLTTWSAFMTDIADNKFDIGMGGISDLLERERVGAFSAPYLQDGKIPLSRCGEESNFTSIKAIDRPEVRVIVNPGGSNERFVHDYIGKAHIETWKNNVSLFDQIVNNEADVMITDVSEALYQQKVHAGLLCAVDPKHPFTVTQKAYWLQPSQQLVEFVNRWLWQIERDGTYQKHYKKWFHI